MATAHPSAPKRAQIQTPRSNGVLANLLAGLFDLAARAGAALAANSGGPWRLFGNVVVASHAQVREVLCRDLDFCIAPINAKRIGEVNGPFVLGMDRGATLARERGALYRALAAVDLAPLRGRVAELAAEKLSGATEIDVVTDFARPIAAETASALFGIPVNDPALFMEVARAVFAHTFLNLGGDQKVRARAIKASSLMRDWLSDEIARRTAAGDLGADMMGALLADPDRLDDDGVRRTLGGLYVGSIDTTATAVAKIIATIAGDEKLAAAMAVDVDDMDRLRGWCWEALRRWPHNPILLRQASVATSLGGVTINKDDRIVVWTQAAMQDAGVFPAPRHLRPDRPASAYLHFGDALHACAGRSVNGFQIPLLVGALVRRGIRSAGKIGWAGPFPDRLIVQLSR
jgi:cytochrome P450